MSPDKPKTPAYEKAAMEMQGKLGEHGSRIAAAHGEDYVTSRTRDKATRATGISSADQARQAARAGIGRSSRKALAHAKVSTASTSKGASLLSLAQAKADGVRGTQLASGAKDAVRESGTLTRISRGLGDIEDLRNRVEDAQDREFEETVKNSAGAVAGYNLKSIAGYFNPQTPSTQGTYRYDTWNAKG